MIQIAQLDPASLSLWLDTSSIGSTRTASAYIDSMLSAVNGDHDDLLTIVDSLEEPARTRAAHLASTIWHEKRHFLDLLLTNYGALRVRQFLRVYVNVLSAVTRAKELDVPLACPLSVYGDPVRRRALGITDIPELGPLGAQLADVEDALAQDRTKVKTPIGPIELGGEAQLEAMAYLCQSATISNRLTPGVALAVERDLYDRVGHHDLRYQWLHRLASALGLVRGVNISPDDADPVVVMGVTALGPITIAALMSRHHGQDQVIDVEGAHGSAWPAMRLAGLLRAFEGRGPEMAEWDEGTAWASVNETCAALWGRSLVEELEADLAREAEFVERIDVEGVPTEVVTFASDIHACRRLLFGVLADDPAAIVDANRFTDVVDELDPLLVNAIPAGADGDPPEGWERLYGYRDPADPAERWWWAAVWPRLPERAVVLRSRPDNIQIARDFAPLTKLLLNGRRHRTMLGVELVQVEKRLEEVAPLRFDPYFEWPPEQIGDLSLLDYLGEGREIVCDRCHRSVEPGRGSLVGPWFFRRPRIGSLAIEELGGGERGYRRFVKDWSPWVLCEECRTTLEAVAG